MMKREHTWQSQTSSNNTRHNFAIPLISLSTTRERSPACHLSRSLLNYKGFAKAQMPKWDLFVFEMLLCSFSLFSVSSVSVLLQPFYLCHDVCRVCWASICSPHSAVISDSHYFSPACFPIHREGFLLPEFIFSIHEIKCSQIPSFPWQLEFLLVYCLLLFWIQTVLSLLNRKKLSWFLRVFSGWYLKMLCYQYQIKHATVFV